MPRRIDVDDLLEATMTVFAKHGYRGTTTRAIANQAGVNEVTLFRRYGDKATLINAAVGYALQRSPLAQVKATGDDLTDDLVGMVRAFAATNSYYGGAVPELLVAMAHHPELESALAAMRSIIRKMSDVIAMYQARGQLTPGDPLQKVFMLFGPLVATGLWERTGAPMGARFKPRAVVAAFLEGHGCD